MARIGGFSCHCGTNIAGTVDIARVVEAAGQMPMVVHATENKYNCSEPGQALIRDAITEHRLSRVVIAACSPRMHENTFRKTVAAAGLTPNLRKTPTLREHCGGVHGGGRAPATTKAIELIRMAVAKVARHEK